MSKVAVQSALFLLSVLVSFATAESPSAVDESHLPRQAQRVGGVLVPVPSEIFSALDRFHDSDWKPVLRPDLAALRPSGSAAHIALSLGIVIAEVFISVAAEDKTEVQQLSKPAHKLARALGVEKSVHRRGTSIVDHAHKKEWAAVRQEWLGVDADLKEAMIEIQSEQLSQLVSLGGWLRGAEALSALASQHYAVRDAQLLHQPVLIDYYTKCLSQMGSKIRADAAVIETERTIIRLRPLIGTERSKPISERDLKEIHTLVSDLVKSIDTKAK